MHNKIKISKHKHELVKMLTSSIDYSFNVIASHQSGLNTNRQDSEKLPIAKYFKAFPIDYNIQLLFSSCK